MTTPPRVHEEELKLAMTAIIERRTRLDDERFGRIDQESPAAVLDYILSHDRNLPPDVAISEIHDGTVLRHWQWWENQRQEYMLLTEGVKRGVDLAELGRKRGLTTSQGTQNRIDHLHALLFRDIPDAKLTRAGRQAGREKADTKDVSARWLTNNRTWLIEVVDNLLAHYSDQDLVTEEAATWLIEVRHDRRADEWSPQSLTLIALAVEELHRTPAVNELHARHPLVRAMGAADILAATFSDDIYAMQKTQDAEARSAKHQAAERRRKATARKRKSRQAQAAARRSTTPLPATAAAKTENGPATVKATGPNTAS